MSLPDRNNPYSFDAFLKWRNTVDYYRDDPFLQQVLKHFTGERWETVHQVAKTFSEKASFRWRDMAERISWPELRPFVMHYDGMNRRIDRIVRPRDTEIMESEIFAEGLFSKLTHPWEKLVKMYLVFQNGEACIACPLTCTEGMVELLRKYSDTPELQYILQHSAEGIDGHFAIGAQYLSEIQGGSDVPSNLLEAVQEGNTWRVFGTKFFCSATHADYAVVTAKPAGSEKVALFVVPSWLPGNREKEIRNGCTIDRIKRKMGTSELTTAEMTFDGAVAYPVGPLDRGLANVVGIVLTYSRLTVGLSASAFMTRAVREAMQYAKFREAFGVSISSIPILAGQIRKIDVAAKNSTAGAFRLYDEFLGLENGLKGGLVEDEPEETRRRRFRVRELIMMQKITTSKDAVEVIRGAMSVFGGHGVMEDFSCLPRLYRDSAVNELWEGPANVLLMQIHRDLQRASDWYPVDEFTRDVLKGCNKDQIEAMAAKMQELVKYPSLFQTDDKTIKTALQWEDLCHRFFHAYQDGSYSAVIGDHIEE